MLLSQLCQILKTSSYFLSFSKPLYARLVAGGNKAIMVGRDYVRLRL
jgi:hypothetical protein